MPRPLPRLDRARLRATLGSLAALIVASDAIPASGAAQAPRDQALDEVVVTAQRRPEPLSRLGASLSRIAPGITGTLDRTHVAAALNRAPGVLMQRGSGQESLLAIRSPVLTGAGACGAFLMLEDGFALRPVGFCNANQLFESNTSQAAAIEVLRGPGTALHGARAVHGIVNVLSPDPSIMPRARVAATGGADRFTGLEFGFSDGENAAWGLWRYDGGFRAGSPVHESKINLAHVADLGGGVLRLRAAATRLDQGTAGFIRGLDAYRDQVLRRSNPNPEAFRDADAERLTAEWIRDDESGRRDEWRGILRRSRMAFLQHFLLGKPLERNGQQSLAVSFARTRPLTDMEWRLGLDAELADTFLLEVQDGPTLEGAAAARAIRPAGKHYDYAVGVQAFAAHASLAAPLGQRSDWRLSVRLDSTRYAYDNRMRDGATAEDGTPCSPAPCLYSRPADRNDRFTDITPRLELRHRLGERSQLHLIASDGFRPPEITELYRLQRNQRVADLDSEHLTALEVGWRYAARDLAAAAALFAQRKRDVILRDANGFNLTGGRTRHDGLEVELGWQTLPSLRLDIAGTYARHRYDFDAAIEGGETIMRGRDIDTAPRQLWTTTATWVPRSDRRVALEWRRVDPYFADAANQRRYPGHTVATLRMSSDPTPDWRISLEIENLTDRLYADRADFAQGDWRYFPARGRSAFVTVEWRQR